MNNQDLDLAARLRTAADFIRTHRNDDPATLRLACAGKKLPFDPEFAVTQIECRRKAAGKLGDFISDDFIFPTVTSAEQASCRQVAAFHASLTHRGEAILDMTAGLGIDAMTMYRAGASVSACEIDSLKAAALLHNAGVSGAAGLKVINIDSRVILSEPDSRYDVIFIDPARRDRLNGRTYAFSECEPDVTALLPLMRQKAGRIYIKASPLLDCSLAAAQLGRVDRIYAVSVAGECKELLFEISGGNDSPASSREEISCSAIILDSEGRQTHRLDAALGNNAMPGRYADRTMWETGAYIYVPDAAVMKIAPWNSILDSYPDIMKAAPNTHLFVSGRHLPDFPGRIFRITEVPDKKKLRSLKGTQLNVISRNHPLDPPAVRRKFGIREGGNDFLICLGTIDGPLAVMASRVRT